MPQAGVAIAVHEYWSESISNVTRYDERHIQLTIQGENIQKPIIISNTYAPHKGYSEIKKAEYWERTKTRIEEIRKKKDIIHIWATDNNGEVGSHRKTKEKEKKQGKAENKEKFKTTGQYTRRDTNEKGNGQKLYKTAKENQMIITNTN